jgi:hypothetical protein
MGGVTQLQCTMIHSQASSTLNRILDSRAEATTFFLSMASSTIRTNSFVSERKEKDKAYKSL